MGRSVLKGPVKSSHYCDPYGAKKDYDVENYYEPVMKNMINVTVYELYLIKNRKIVKKVILE